MQLWTVEHVKTLLPAVAVMLFAAWILHRYLGDKRWEIRMIPFHILTAAIVLLEIGKQVTSLRIGYDLYHLPFHFCSMFIFMMPVMSLYRGKRQEAVRGITAALFCATSLLTLIYPSLIYGAADIQSFFTRFLSFHTVAFHNIVLFGFILILALRLHTPEVKTEQKSMVLFMVCFCVISATMAQVLKTNFNNFYSCNIAPLETLRQNMQAAMGYGATQAIYILIVTVLDILFVFGSYWLYIGLRKLTAGKQMHTVS